MNSLYQDFQASELWTGIMECALLECLPLAKAEPYLRIQNQEGRGEMYSGWLNNVPT